MWCTEKCIPALVGVAQRKAELGHKLFSMEGKTIQFPCFLCSRFQDRQHSLAFALFSNVILNLS